MKPSYEDFQFDTAQTDDVEVVEWDGVSDDCGYNLDDQQEIVVKKGTLTIGAGNIDTKTNTHLWELVVNRLMNEGISDARFTYRIEVVYEND